MPNNDCKTPTTKRIFIIDVSGSIFPYLDLIRQLLSSTHLTPSNNNVFMFHHENLGLLDVSKLGNSMGLTDITIAIGYIRLSIQECVTNGERFAIYLVTDGAHNASPITQLLEEIVLLMNELQSIDTTDCSFNAITCGSYYPKTLLSAINSMFWMTSEITRKPMIRYRQDTIDHLILTDGEFGEALEKLDYRVLVKGLGLLKNFSTNQGKCDIENFMNKFLQNLQEKENDQKETKSVSSPQTWTWSSIIRSLKTVSTNDTESKMLARIYAGEKPESKTNIIDKLFERISNSPIGDFQLAPDSNIDALTESFKNGDVSSFLDGYFVVIVLHQNNTCSTIGLLDCYIWLKTNTALKLFVCCKPSVEFPFVVLLSELLDLVQQQLLPNTQLSSPQNLSTYRSLFVTDVLKVQGRYDYVCLCLQTIAQSFRPLLFSWYVFNKATEEICSDRKVQQGDPQNFTGTVERIDVRPYLMMFLAILLYPRYSTLDISSITNIPVKILAVLGMMTRFSLDANNYDIATLFGSDINIHKLAELMLFLSSSNISHLEIKECNNTFLRNGEILADEKMGLKEKLIKITSQKSELNADRKTDEPELSDLSVVTILWLLGITDFVELSRRFRAILSICQRKTKENFGETLEIYKLLNEIIQFPPNEALKSLSGFLMNRFSNLVEYPEWTLFQNLLSFAKYSKTMEILFLEPPSSQSGWYDNTPNPKVSVNELSEIRNYVGPSNVSFFPITSIPSAEKIQNMFNDVKRISQIHKAIHGSNMYHVFDPSRVLENSDGCICGMPFFSPVPKKAVVDGKITSIDCIASQNRQKHIGTWGLFVGLRHAITLQDHIDVISNNLKDVNCSKAITSWALVNGGIQIWKDGNLTVLRLDGLASLVVEQLSWFV